MSAGNEVIEDYHHLGLTLRRHPLAFLRAALRGQGVATCAQLQEARDGQVLTTAGLVLVRQMPGSAKGVLFVTLEDETGSANLIVWPKVFARQRRVILAARLLAVEGRIQRAGEVVHLIAQRLHDRSAMLRWLRQEAADHLPDAQERHLPRARDFR